MFYVLQFTIGGTMMLLASWLSRSNLHFLAGIISDFKVVKYASTN